jgi:RNA polymerase sigma-70 factor (ECF subfamily)
VLIEVAVDGDLVVRARAGDVEAFSALTETRLPRMYRVARLIVRDDDAAADAVQEALIAAWRDLPSLRDSARFDAWLHRLLARTCQRAATRRRSGSVIEIHLSPDLVGTVPDHQRALAVRDQLERGFERLPPGQRAVVVLRHYLGLSLAETAEAMGIPIGTVESRQNRAMQALRAGFDADERGPLRPSEAVR